MGLARVVYYSVGLASNGSGVAATCCVGGRGVSYQRLCEELREMNFLLCLVKFKFDVNFKQKRL